MSFVFSLLVMAALLAACGPEGSNDWKTPLSPVPTIGQGTTLPPVLILPGWGGAPELVPPAHNIISCDWSNPRQGAIEDLENHIPNDESYNGLGPAIRALGKSGDLRYSYAVTYHTYLSTACYTAVATDTENFNQIEIGIAKARREANAPDNTPVVIIAHSTSGRAVRAYIERTKEDGTFTDDVAEVFTLGTPYNGVNPHYFWIALLTVPDNMTIRSYIENQNIDKNFVYYPTPVAYDKANRNPNVIYHLIGGYLIGDQRSIKAKAIDYFGDRLDNDDGLVPWASALSLAGAGDYQRYNEGHDDSYASVFHKTSYFSPSAPTDHNARAYILKKLDERARVMLSAPVSSPTGTPPPFPTGPLPTQPSTPQIPCTPREDVQAVATLGPGAHVGDALAELVNQCHGEIAPEEVLSPTKDSNLRVQLISFDREAADVILSMENIEPGGVYTAGLAASTLSITQEGTRAFASDIPGSAVVVSGTQVYLFGPEDALPLILLRTETMQLKVYNTKVDDNEGRIYDLSIARDPFGQPNPYYTFDTVDPFRLYQLVQPTTGFPTPGIPRTPGVFPTPPVRGPLPSLPELALRPGLAPRGTEVTITPEAWDIP